ncbi:MAG: membrane-bound lytic murein transglycosylase MltF [Gammaproteobacteria bacterium]|nr:membrane-bound lytic murein transglycosylase MltF [Gammaproteobacteria bacterium]MDH5631204.1 membrane-bound lytic murein transglycosylase MltF [Gammaproteobacteria bacterium]
MKKFTCLSHHSCLLNIRSTLTNILVLIAGLLILSGCNQQPQITQLEKVQKQGVIKVVTRNSPTTFYEGTDEFAGLEYDLVKRFAKSLNVKVEFVVEDNLKRINDMVANGEVDFAAAGLTITPEREKIVRFTPAYQQITSRVVFKQGKKWPRSLKNLNGELRILAHSSYSEMLLNLKPDYPKLRWSETTEHTSEELLMMVLDETIDYTIVDSNELDLNRRFHPDLAVAFSLGEPQEIAWAFPKNDDHTLFSQAIAFFGKQHSQGKIASLNEKYYGHVADFDYVGARHFHQASKDELNKYKSIFIDSAGSDLDWRLLAALSYQESHWNPNATSATGVRGLMMLTKKTAKLLGVKDRLDPVESIYGGANYLRKLFKRIPASIEEPDKTWFALAGYNVGWGHVEDARIITHKQGGNPNKWADVKQRLPLLQKKKWYRQTKHGYARGSEPVKYVDNIRRYYDVLVWQDEEQVNPDPMSIDPQGKKEEKVLTAQ